VLPTADRIEFDDMASNTVGDPADRRTVNNAARIMLSLHYPTIRAQRWVVEAEEDYYNVVVQFPAMTWFDARQLSLVSQVNEVLVTRVWVQPKDTGEILLCASVQKAGADLVVNVQTLCILQASATRPGPTKRRRLDGP
jgi:hypothetical protein